MKRGQRATHRITFRWDQLRDGSADTTHTQSFADEGARDETLRTMRQAHEATGTGCTLTIDGEPVRWEAS